MTNADAVLPGTLGIWSLKIWEFLRLKFRSRKRLCCMIVAEWSLLILAFVSAFVLGAIVGSFLNVCIARLPQEKSLLWPPGSRCGHCFQPVRWHDNIPLVSYWVLRGRCRSCGATFSSRYFFVELATAL